MSTATYRSKVIADLPHGATVTFVDPGIMGTGWCKMHVPTHPALAMYGELESGVIEHDPKQTWAQNIWRICSEFEDVFLVCGCPERVVFEFPELWENAKSHASAAKGDLHKLAFLIGAMSIVAYMHVMESQVMVFPREWKGQLPKSVVIARVAKIIGRVPVNHEADAIGMAIAAVMGRI